MQVLSAVKAGITRLREKGGASPESLYDLLNGYVTAARTIKNRPGSEVDCTGLGATIGFVLFGGKFVVFASNPVTIANTGYRCEVLKHPDPASGAYLEDVRFAAPFLGYLYVVAKWSDGKNTHYWLQSAEKWQPNHVYQEGQVVMPTTDNGLAYRAKRLTAPAPPWAPDAKRALGDKVEPTKANGYGYTVVEVDGDNPRSGKKEPAWVASEGGLTYEDVDSAPATPPATTPPPGTTLPPGTDDRYGGRSAGRTGTRGEQ